MMTQKEREYVQQLEQKIVELQAIIAKQAKRIAELERRLNMNSSNSSQPPSKDGFRPPKRQSSRKPSGKKPGGQEGHKGAGLGLPHEQPDTVSECRPKDCDGCPSADVCAGRKVERRYKIDAEVAVRVHAYDLMEYVCPKKGNETIRGEFPQDIRATKQYGSQIKALVVALSAEGAVSVKRIHDLLHALTSVPVSTGFIHDTIRSFADSLETSIDYIKRKLALSPVVHVDETGMRAGKDGIAWVHSASTGRYTYQTTSRKRGKDGMVEAGFLPGYTGILVHDCWRAYWLFPAERHGICLAHILRELQGIQDNDPSQKWAKWFMELLLEMKRVKERLQGRGAEAASRYYLRKFDEEWDIWVEAGKSDNPLEETETGKRGRRSRARCLVDRLEAYKNEALLFFRDFRVPFDNNQAERDVRPVKTKMKVSGCFRTEEGRNGYARINSVISTAKKHGLNVLHTIASLLDNPDVVPWDMATE